MESKDGWQRKNKNVDIQDKNKDRMYQIPKVQFVASNDIDEGPRLAHLWRTINCSEDDIRHIETD